MDLGRGQAARRRRPKRPGIISLAVGKLPDPGAVVGAGSVAAELGDLAVHRRSDLVPRQSQRPAAPVAGNRRRPSLQRGHQTPLPERLRAGALHLLQGLVEQEIGRDHADIAVVRKPLGLAVERSGISFEPGEIGL